MTPSGPAAAITPGPLRLRLPATSANLGPGFDTLALALALYLEIDSQPAAAFSIEATGRNQDICAALEGNLLLETYKETWSRFRSDPPLPLALTLHNGIPLGMGCGSSAASRLAGLALASHYGQLGWDRARMLDEATALEHHPDNAAACCLGGFVTSAYTLPPNGPGSGRENEPGDRSGNEFRKGFGDGSGNEPRNEPANGPGNAFENRSGNGPGDRSGNGPGDKSGNGPGNGSGSGPGDGSGKGSEEGFEDALLPLHAASSQARQSADPERDNSDADRKSSVPEREDPVPEREDPFLKQEKQNSFCGNLVPMWGTPELARRELLQKVRCEAQTARSVAAISIAPPRDWFALLVLPEQPLATTVSRAVLPDQYSRPTVVDSLGSLALLVAAFATGDGSLLRTATADQLHQPFRAAACPLLPRLLPLAGSHGILSVTLSGAGSGVLCLLAHQDAIPAATASIRAAAGDPALGALAIAELLPCSLAFAPALLHP